MPGHQLAYAALVVRDVDAIAGVFERQLGLRRSELDAGSGKAPVFGLGAAAIAFFPAGHPYVGGQDWPGVHHIALAAADLIAAAEAATRAGAGALGDPPVPSLGGGTRMALDPAGTAGVSTWLTAPLALEPSRSPLVERVDHLQPAAGAPPATWFIDDLMRGLDAPYYVGVLTAAAHHGASHQAPQEFQVVTTRPRRPIAVGRNRIRFIVKARLERTSVIEVKTVTGTMRVSTAEATALDLLRYVEHAGFLSNVATVLRDLAEACQPRRLVKAAEADGELAYAQRLGFLLDLVGVARLADPLAQWVETQRPSLARLNPAQPERAAPRDHRWRLIVNDSVEPDT
jgi:predicted transcriptional regulator of viral defense system